MTTNFIGGYYEKKGSEITKYYFAGATRIAMRKYTIPQNMTVEYMFGDHLGSTSLTTDTNGEMISEIRYKPWGETRYTSIDAPANTSPAYELVKYQYTGQYSYDAEFGLKFYGARFYDSAVGRFVSADTVIPGGTQGYDRYAFTYNNPLRYVDPSGHNPCDEQDEDADCVDATDDLIDQIQSNYDVNISGGWDEDELLLLLISLNKLAAYLGGVANLNQAIQASLDAAGKNPFQSRLVLANGPGYCHQQSSNCYNAAKGKITIGDDTFTDTYQAKKKSQRPSELGLDITEMGVQVSIVHEFAHMLKVAAPVSLKLYSNKENVLDPLATDRDHGYEENMANAIAFYVVSGGGTSSRFQGQLDFAQDYAYIWDY